MAALSARGVTGDFRLPDRLHLGFSARYTRVVAVWGAGMILASVLTTESWRNIRSTDLGQLC